MEKFGAGIILSPFTKIAIASPDKENERTASKKGLPHRFGQVRFRPGSEFRRMEQN